MTLQAAYITYISKWNFTMNKEQTMEFKELFRECRIKHFLTQRNMAHKLNIPISTLKSWEQGTAIPNYENWIKIKQIYSTNETDITQLEDLYLQRKLKKK